MNESQEHLAHSDPTFVDPPWGRVDAGCSTQRLSIRGRRYSELKLEGKLDRAGTADLAGVKAAVGAAGTEAAGQRLRRVAEKRTGQAVVRISEVCVVEDIEELQAEAKPRVTS